MLRASDLTVYYGAVKALEGVSFEIGAGEIVAMIGPNGAGKSTALKAISGLLPHSGGELRRGDVHLDGASIIHLRTDELVGKGIALVPEGRRVFPTMTVKENLEMGGYIRKDRRQVAEDLESVLDLFPRLKERVRQKAGTLSSGEQQMLVLGRALMLRPRLLLADEPSLGLSPNFVDIIFEKLVDINRRGTSVLLVEQNARMALDVAHRAYVFEIGRIGLTGTGSSLKNDPRVQEAFLGGTSDAP